MLRYIDSNGVLLSREELRAGLGQGRVRVVLEGFEESIVDESARADTDLNELVKRWSRGEAVPQFTQAQFADLSEAGDFQEMQERLLVVESAFARLPADVREHFRNSPVLFADAMVDPARVAELQGLGILEAPQEPVVAVPEVPVAPVA